MWDKLETKRKLGNTIWSSNRSVLGKSINFGYTSQISWTTHSHLIMGGTWHRILWTSFNRMGRRSWSGRGWKFANTRHRCSRYYNSKLISVIAKLLFRYLYYICTCSRESQPCCDELLWAFVTLVGGPRAQALPDGVAGTGRAGDSRGVSTWKMA